jgi:asparagine synthase (glutamine-hydrolysing)
LPKLVWHYNEPFADSSAIPTYYVANVTRDYVKVVLAGDAGDENFAGYPRYLRSQWVASFTRVPDKLRKALLPNLLRTFSAFRWKEKTLNRLADFVESLSRNQARNYAEQIKIFNAKEKEDIYTEDFNNRVGGIDSLDFLINKFEESDAENLLDSLLYVDINSYLPEDLLVKVDIATMANSLEARLPFLDHEFMEFIASIPSRLKLQRSKTKFILKTAFKDFLPEAILKRKKMGFGVPVSEWFRNELKDYVYEILLDNKSLSRGYFNPEGVRRLLEDHVHQRNDHSVKLWALLVLELWFRVFMDREGDFFLYAV